jgi:hypothetical protein
VRRRPWSLAAVLDLLAAALSAILLFFRTMWSPEAASTYVARGRDRHGDGGGNGGGGRPGGGGGGGGPRVVGMDAFRGNPGGGGCSSCRG